MTDKKTPGASEIAEWIRDRIRKGRMVPGQRLVEADIMRQTGASRFKVREAFQRLEGEGLVHTEEFRGASVRSATHEEIRQIYRCRAALEGSCAADFTHNATSGQRERLLDLQVQLEACVEENESERFGRLNMEWHQLLIEGAGNAVAGQLLERLHVPVHRLMFESFYSANRLRAANADHRRIIDAIMANDPVSAENAMRSHVAAGLDTLNQIDSEVLG
ncbi:GntR family transcriptional regulator [Novosphingobium sp. PP1Y]|uniref:GntR family transcriptional regulator n=1 Tax=Novosphingobium sp. PP1Y TaxID=702113 RepID=UPI00020EFDF3|nr:GntR family transcriptional regulator [Novosphingobium sp. PP1Y]CCA90967.1 GntR family transcriptional regulator [Novosphingobium sp. PP1Y]